MLKIMHGNKFFSVFVLSAITIMITIAFVFWGIGPNDNPTIEYVAQVGDRQISLKEYYRAYDNEYERQRAQKKTPEEIKKLDLEKLVLGSLVDRMVLLITAENVGISVTDKELQREIMNTPYFQRNGKFDQNIYRRLLSRNRMTMQEFEQNVKNDLIIVKMTRLIGETSELSKKEIDIIESIKGGNKQELIGVFRATKNSQVVQAYIEGIKRRLPIRVNLDMVS